MRNASSTLDASSQYIHIIASDDITTNIILDVRLFKNYLNLLPSIDVDSTINSLKYKI